MPRKHKNVVATHEDLVPWAGQIPKFGDMVLEEMKARKIKRGEFARAAGLPRATMDALFANEIRPDQATAKAISLGLGKPRIDPMFWIVLDRNILWDIVRQTSWDLSQAASR